MTSHRERLRAAQDRGRDPSERIQALKDLATSTEDDVLVGLTTIVEAEGEIPVVAYEAGWTLARLHFERGTVDDVFWANFSRAGHLGFFDSAAQLNGVPIVPRKSLEA